MKTYCNLQNLKLPDHFFLRIINNYLIKNYTRITQILLEIAFFSFIKGLDLLDSIQQL